ncbi:hypothetical protein [Methylobacter sp.]|uniref:hypothetical protein n=1 Tax=Methylobacter sp. TaxID=2051955 RepID=UPI001201309F|nr:hypothetical protein [Methylobacter sp.]TAK59528.1 MAG: hypothetical protein EPO18_20415 [Methylobacter sp.]
MHDPSTVAHEIKYPWWRSKHQDVYGKWSYYHDSFITIWHEDPETDGSDDSCGWFIRSRHADQKVLEAIVKDFDFEWDRETGGWFHPVSGDPRLSLHAIALNMFATAVHRMFDYDWDKRNAFMNAHLYQILYFAENNTDSMYEGLVQKYGRSRSREERVAQHAGMVYTWILRALRPWYKHPRWHVWHWRIQVHPLQSFKRWAFSKCCRCQKGFSWGYCPTSNSWNGKGPSWTGEEGVYHNDCRNPEADCVAQAVGPAPQQAKPTA